MPVLPAAKACWPSHGMFVYKFVPKLAVDKILTIDGGSIRRKQNEICNSPGKTILSGVSIPEDRNRELFCCSRTEKAQNFDQHSQLFCARIWT